jgi:pilus assembly protein CpaB
MLGLALLAGLIAAWLSMRWMDNQVQSRTQARMANITRVAVAVDSLRAGQEIAEKSVQMVEWPVGSLPPGAMTEAKDAIGRIVKSPISKGEPLTESRLAPKGARGGLAAILSPGKRAISVGVNEVVGVAGEALEGSYVDVMVNSTDNSDSERQRSISKIVLERVKVLAVPQSQPNSTRITAVSLEVTPSEAERIDLARSVGTLSLVLRSQDEGEADPSSRTPNSRGATKDALFGGTNQAVVVARPAGPAVQRPPATRVEAQPAPVAAPSVPVATPAAVPKPRVCVEAYVGSERRSECF